MFKLMIVEDEPEIRQHIKSMIDWENLNLELVVECGDSDVVMENAAIFQPQIVIMDICLPGKDGLCLSKELKQWNPNVKIIIVSSYQDFAYAQMAMSIGISDYLTKPVVSQELNDILKKTLGDIKARVEDQQRKYAANYVVDQNRDVLQRWQLEHLMQADHSRDDAQLRQQLGVLEIDLSGSYCNVIQMFIQNSTAVHRGWEQKSGAIQQYLQTTLKEAGLRGYGYFEEGKDFHCLVNGNTPNLEERLEDICKVFVNEMKLYFGMSLYAGIGSSVKALNEIFLSARQAETALHKALLLDEQVSCWVNVKENKYVSLNENKDLIYRDMTNMILNIRKGDYKAVEDLIGRLRSTFRTAAEQQEFCLNLLEVFSVECSNLGFSLRSMIDYHAVERTVKVNIGKGNFEKTVLSLCKTFDQVIQNREQDANQRLIKKAKDYIETHYQEEGLSLDQVSRYVNLSKSYFSSLFHKIEKTTFKTYLVEVRIREAKRLLLATDKRIYEICCEVGCSDAAYFNRTFKKLTGMTPLQFRNNGHRE